MIVAVINYLARFESIRAIYDSLTYPKRSIYDLNKPLPNKATTKLITLLVYYPSGLIHRKYWIIGLYIYNDIYGTHALYNNFNLMDGQD